MTQSSSLGAVPTGSGVAVRTGFNLADQALATQNEGPTAPSPTYAFMSWRNDAAGLLHRRNASNTGWDIVENYGAVTNPGVADDAGLGYVRGALWVNAAASRIFVCLDPAAGAAVWAEVASATGVASAPAFASIAVAGQPTVVADAAAATLTLAGTGGLAITTDAGSDTITLAPSYGAAVNTVCQGNDARLADARAPLGHAASHHAGGSDPLRLDELAAATDVTALNASASAHGLCPKLSGNAAHRLDGSGAWSAPPYDILCGIVGSPSDSEVVLLLVVPRPFRIPVDAAGSRLAAGTAASVSAVFSVEKNGSTFLTATVGAAGTTAAFTGSQIDFAAGDVLRVVAPATADATLADIAITLVATLL